MFFTNLYLYLSEILSIYSYSYIHVFLFISILPCLPIFLTIRILSYVYYFYLSVFMPVFLSIRIPI